MTALPWADMTFDAALSTSTIHHHLRANIIQTLDEIRRVLKPGGLFLVDFPSTVRLDYQRLRSQVAAGQIAEVEPNTFVDERPDSEDPDGFLPHHYCDEADARDLLRAFELLRLWIDLPESASSSSRAGQWIGWARKPLSDA
jgi:SAM-dependent methyltransferase